MLLSPARPPRSGGDRAEAVRRRRPRGPQPCGAPCPPTADPCAATQQREAPPWTRLGPPTGLRRSSRARTSARTTDGHGDDASASVGDDVLVAVRPGTSPCARRGPRVPQGARRRAARSPGGGGSGGSGSSGSPTRQASQLLVEAGKFFGRPREPGRRRRNCPAGLPLPAGQYGDGLRQRTGAGMRPRAREFGIAGSPVRRVAGQLGLRGQVGGPTADRLLGGAPLRRPRRFDRRPVGGSSSPTSQHD